MHQSLRLFVATVTTFTLIYSAFASSPTLRGSYSHVPSRSDWSGVYFGIHGGGGWGGMQTFVVAGEGVELRGGIFGGHIGYQHQSGGIVFGLEGDFSGSTVEHSGMLLGSTVKYSIDWLSSLRARWGIAPADGLLLYATGGIAWGEAKAMASGGLLSGSAKDTMVGYVIGAGAQINFMSGLSGRLEVLHYNFPSQSVDVGLAVNVPYSADTTVVRAGVDWRPF